MTRTVFEQSVAKTPAVEDKCMLRARSLARLSVYHSAVWIEWTCRRNTTHINHTLVVTVSALCCVVPHEDLRLLWSGMETGRKHTDGLFEISELYPYESDPLPFHILYIRQYIWLFIISKSPTSMQTSSTRKHTTPNQCTTLYLSKVGVRWYTTITHYLVFFSWNLIHR